MTGVCTGYQEGSSALAPDGTLRWDQHRERAVGIDAVDDDWAWHELADHRDVSMRRARRLDLWTSGSTVRVDAFFQDSSTLPEGGRQSIHEYALTAEAGAEGLVLRSVEPVPRGCCPTVSARWPCRTPPTLSASRSGTFVRGSSASWAASPDAPTSTTCCGPSPTLRRWPRNSSPSSTGRVRCEGGQMRSQAGEFSLGNVPEKGRRAP